MSGLETSKENKPQHFQPKHKAGVTLISQLATADKFSCSSYFRQKNKVVHL